MKYEIITTDNFEREFKQLSKKYASLPNDYEIFIKELRNNPNLGSVLGKNIRKIRMAIASKNKGKRGGARVITCNVFVGINDMDIYLLSIYDKGERDKISMKEILNIKLEEGLII